MSTMYDEDFYRNRHRTTLYSAERIINIVSSFCPQFSSVIDFGCGVGTWLSLFHKSNVSITGVDGLWVPQEFLVIPKDCFIPCNIQEALKKSESEILNIPKHDFAISLEVAEHIEESCAEQFIKVLTSHTDYILFSAAVPSQGGTGHVNEQWPSYWAEKFSHYDFELFDVIRHQIWDDDNIPFWYRQNCFLGARKGLLNLPAHTRVIEKKFDIAHPQLLKLVKQREAQVLTQLCKAVPGIRRIILAKN